MLGWTFTDLEWWLGSPLALLGLGFNIWMLLDAVRRDEWMWVFFLILFPVVNALLYYFMVYRPAPAEGEGFALPGAADRKRIRDLEQKILHLDNAHHYLELGDLYFRRGRFDAAVRNYEAAHQREPENSDIKAHLGVALLELNRPAEARRLLEEVCLWNPGHDYGSTLMALGECLALLNETDSAIEIWERAVARHSHARARVRLAELLVVRGERERARQLVDEVIKEESCTPEFQRRQEAEWLARARRLAGELGGK